MPREKHSNGCILGGAVIVEIIIFFRPTGFHSPGTNNISVDKARFTDGIPNTPFSDQFLKEDTPYPSSRGHILELSQCGSSGVGQGSTGPPRTTKTFGQAVRSAVIHSHIHLKIKRLGNHQLDRGKCFFSEW